jgi:hypothetical protein
MALKKIIKIQTDKTIKAKDDLKSH